MRREVAEERKQMMCRSFFCELLAAAHVLRIGGDQVRTVAPVYVILVSIKILTLINQSFITQYLKSRVRHTCFRNCKTVLENIAANKDQES